MDAYLEQIEKVKEHKTFYHYTDKLGFDAIRNGKALRLSAINLVNDPIENKRIKSIWNGKIYILCFTHEKNDEYFKSFYGAEYRFEFSLEQLINIREIYYDAECTQMIEYMSKYSNRSVLEHSSYSEWSDWAIFDKSLFDVRYDDNLDAYKYGLYESNAGMIKQINGIDVHNNQRDWSVEKETRLRVAVRPIGFEHILVNNHFESPRPPMDVKNKSYLYVKLPENTYVEQI